MTCGLCHQLSSSYFALNSPNLALAEEIQSTTASHFHFLVRSVLLIESERAGGRLWRPLLGKASVRSIAGRVGAGDQGHVCSAQALMVPSHTSQLPHRHVRRGRLGPQHRLRREQVLAGFRTFRNSISPFLFSAGPGC